MLYSPRNIVHNMTSSFFVGESYIPSLQKLRSHISFALPNSKTSQCYKDRQLRDHLKEDRIDQMIMDSFPASDPPSTY